jgi:hypothetical protein
VFRREFFWVWMLATTLGAGAARRTSVRCLALIDAPPRMTNPAFDDGIDVRTKPSWTRHLGFRQPRRVQLTQSQRQIAASRYVGCMAAVATSPIVAVTMRHEASRVPKSRTAAAPQLPPCLLPKLGAQPDKSLIPGVAHVYRYHPQQPLARVKCTPTAPI